MMQFVKVLLGTFGACLLYSVADAQVTFTTPALTGGAYTSTHYIAENAAVSTTITTVVATGGTSPYTYTAKDSGGSAIATTSITTTSGNIVIASASYLNYETATNVVIKIEAADSAGTPVTGTATLTIMVIDLPSFSPLEMLMCAGDGSVAGTTIGNIAADGTGSMTYARTASGNDANATDFTVSTAGAITVSTGITLSAQRDQVYTLKVDAVSGSETGTAMVNIYVGCSLSSATAAVTSGVAVMLIAFTSAVLSG